MEGLINWKRLQRRPRVPSGSGEDDGMFLELVPGACARPPSLSGYLGEEPEKRGLPWKRGF